MDDAAKKGEELCLSCGLCCMGAFHTMALIPHGNTKDIDIVKSFNGRFMEHDNKLWFRLACPAFDGRCSIYPERPSTCGKHQCDLLKSVKNGTIPLEKGLSLVRQMKHVFTELDFLLDNLVGKEETKEITQRFYRFFQSKGKETKTDVFHSKYAELLQKYAIFSFLKENYFYKDNNDAIDN